MIESEIPNLFLVAQEEIFFWIENLHRLNERKFNENIPSVYGWCDASGFAVGGFFVELKEFSSTTRPLTADNLLKFEPGLVSLAPGQPWQVDRMSQNLKCTVPNKPFELDSSKISDHTFVHKQLTVVEQSMDSNEREMLAAYCLISSSVGLLQNKTVVLHMDNLNASNICLKGSSKFKLKKYAIKISDICQQFSINLQTVWIPRSLNRFADKMSKLTDI